MMKGKKTWLAAIVSIVYGLGGMIADLHDADTGVGFIVAGLGMIGIGHKVDKIGK